MPKVLPKISVKLHRMKANTLFLYILVPLFLSLSCLNNKKGQLLSRAIIDPNEGTSANPPAANKPPEKEKIKRPSGEVFINPDYCSCLNGKPDILNNSDACGSFCSKKTDSVATLYLNVRLGATIALNTQLGSLYGWCKKEIDDGLTKPGCKMEIKDEFNNTQYLDVDIPTNGNTLKTSVAALDRDITYMATIVETDSGSNARSSTIQIRRTYIHDQLPSLGHLMTTPINEYFCIRRSGSINKDVTPNMANYDLALRWHFYYSDLVRPETMTPNGDGLVICHDLKLGINDSPEFPRLGLFEQDFFMWSESDSRFFDLDQNGELDVNDYIAKRLTEEFNYKDPKIKLFFPWPWFTNPDTSSATGTTSGGSASNTRRLGFLMQPFIDSTTKQPLCPGQSEYHDTNYPQYLILGDLIGVDTQALYMAKRENLSFVNDGKTEKAPNDFIFITESQLMKIGFYRENNMSILVDSQTINTKQIMFYWPADENYPLVRKPSSQKLYEIRHPSNLNADSGSVNQDLFKTSQTPSDKRFACVPKVD